MKWVSTSWVRSSCSWISALRITRCGGWESEWRTGTSECDFFTRSRRRYWNCFSGKWRPLGIRKSLRVWSSYPNDATVQSQDQEQHPEGHACQQQRQAVGPRQIVCLDRIVDRHREGLGPARDIPGDHQGRPEFPQGAQEPEQPPRQDPAPGDGKHHPPEELPFGTAVHPGCILDLLADLSKADPDGLQNEGQGGDRSRDHGAGPSENETDSQKP